MIQIDSNGSRWYGQPPATLDELIQSLESHPLDPRFEKYGNFIDETGHPGATNFFGNFYGVSHVFNITTDQPEIIERLTIAIRANQATPAYQQAQQESPQ